MNVVFKARKSNLQSISIPAGMEITVERYGKSAVGGCKEATLQVKAANREDLYQLILWLEAKAVISDDIGRAVWWGYVGAVEIQDGPNRMKIDLDSMSNRIAVAYTTVSYGEETTGTRMTTAWQQADTSVAEFGIKELLYGIGGTTETHALAARARLLEQLGYPIALPDSNGDGAFGATLTLRGWWSTLEWRYASVPTRLALGFETIGTLAQSVGAVVIVGLAQSFDIGSTINLQDIDLYISRTGTPAEDLTVGIFENPDDLTPGAQLASTTITPASIATTAGWIRATLSAPLALAAGTYFLVATTTGLDASNFYGFVLDGAQGYGAGVLRQKKDTDWHDGPVGDMPFRLYANDLVETSQQIKGLITNYGQFLRKVFLDIASGIDTESYRSGDNDARMEIEDLMGAGTDNNRRMFAEVDQDRNVRIFEQPASTTYVLLGRDGVFRNTNGAELDLVMCPVGMWALPTVLTGSVDAAPSLGVQKFLVEETEYDVASKRLNYTPAMIDNPWDLGVAHG